MQPPRIEEYYAYSSEKPALIYELRQQMKDRYEWALDVGAGNGEISQVLAERANHLHLCEANLYYAPVLQSRFPAALFSFEPIQTAKLHKYDCILISQSLYYHPASSWTGLVEKLAQHLQPEGEMYIVLNTDQGEWWDAVRGPLLLQPQSLKFSYIPSAAWCKELAKCFHVQRSTFQYGMRFPDQTAMESYVRNACVPIHARFAEAETAIADYVSEWPSTKLTMDYKTDIIRLRRRKDCV